MPETLYRGKPKSALDKERFGEWVVGYYCPTPFGNFPPLPAIYPKDRMDAGEWCPVEIVPETLCAEIGLNDKNGTHIFDGDVLHLTDKVTDISMNAKVEFGNPNGTYDWGFQLVSLDATCTTPILLWIEMEETGAFAEIIGNIYDNPELLAWNEKE